MNRQTNRRTESHKVFTARAYTASRGNEEQLTSVADCLPDLHIDLELRDDKKRSPMPAAASTRGQNSRRANRACFDWPNSLPPLPNP